jgi:hypothetical protein
MPRLTCPYCRVFANFTGVHGWSSDIRGRGSVSYSVWRCDYCRRPILGEVSPSGDPHDQHPKYVPDPKLPDVPEQIAEDAREAFRCFAVESYRATAAMARRALQAAAFEKGAPDKPLIEQIDWLATNGQITEQMKDVAHQIRLGGNLGAHPDRDGLRDVDQASARAILGFLRDFFRYVYEIPASLDRLKTGSGDEPES